MRKEQRLIISLHPGSGFIVSDGSHRPGVQRVWCTSTKDGIRDWIYRHLPFGDWKITIEDRCDPATTSLTVEEFHHEYVQ